MFGPHINDVFPKTDRIQENVDFARKMKIKFGAYQIFLASPISLKQNAEEEINDVETEALCKYNENLRCIIHGPYVLPLVSKIKYSMSIVRHLLRDADKINAKGLVIHIPNKPKNELLTIMREFPTNYNTNIYFETTPSKSPKLKNLDDYFDLLQSIVLISPKFGLCIDTAHLWGAGIDVSDDFEFPTWLNSLPNISDNLMFHLNDSEVLKGSGKDKHASLCKGNIWGLATINKSGLHDIVDFCIKNKLTAIFERHNKADYDVDLSEFDISTQNTGVFSNLYYDYKVLYKLSPSVRISKS